MALRKKSVVRKKVSANAAVKKELRPKITPPPMKEGQRKPVAYQVAIGDVLGMRGEFPRGIMVETLKPDICKLEIEHTDGTCRVLQLQSSITGYDLYGEKLDKEICASGLYPVPSNIKRIVSSTALKNIVFY